MNTFSFPVNIKVNACSYLQQNNPFTYAASFFFVCELYHEKRYLYNNVYEILSYCLTAPWYPKAPIAFAMHFLPPLEFHCLPIDRLVLFSASLQQPHSVIARPNLTGVTGGLETWELTGRNWMQKGLGDGNTAVIDTITSLLLLISVRHLRSEERENKDSDSGECVHPG